MSLGSDKNDDSVVGMGTGTPLLVTGTMATLRVVVGGSTAMGMNGPRMMAWDGPPGAGAGAAAACSPPSALLFFVPLPLRLFLPAVVVVVVVPAVPAVREENEEELEAAVGVPAALLIVC